ncbi:hypothetical protein SNE25_21365 [Mucilaginibacter sabulilitoris]|uniref:YkuD domain-containing protein n=1 Tax=Mucilaginibacter sabulilitoris TaxID=1173583 RepID=A0ABZ0TGJ0_9SPHI|nr:hypothetical protein [Mucilaginibacter sabulilitoris]WPU91869.1 hypothetical protein SNE25_21365 [Mucilaginibacter sabulilitoris]
MGITFKITRKNGGKAEGVLSWPEKNLSSPAVSGPYGAGFIESGAYRARRNVLLDKDGIPAYCDPNSKCWFQLLDPQFQTARTDIGIHPDGNVPGTEGCIGITVNDTKPWYDALYSVASGSYTTVDVTEEILIADNGNGDV